VHVSKVRSVDLDNWDATAVATMRSRTNQQVNEELEFHVSAACVGRVRVCVCVCVRALKVSELRRFQRAL
jgi:hypothetical protein